MIGYTCAYLRYYYPTEFIASYLNNANNNDDTVNGTTLATQLKIKINPIKFGKSSALYRPVASERAIYKGLASIKGFGIPVSEALYEVSKNFKGTFFDFLKVNPCSSAQTETLIKLNFFSEFGTSAKLLQILSLFGEFYSKKEGVYVSKKQIKKTDLKGFSIEQLNKYADKETPSAYVFSDMTPLIQSRIDDIPDSEIPVRERLEAQFEYLGYIQPSGNAEDYKRGYVLQAYPINRKKDNTFCGFNLTIQFLATGNVTNFTYWTKDKKAIAKKDVIEVLTYSTDEYKNQKKFILKTFKKI